MCRFMITIIFFFSSRRRHTRWPRDWSSDVCSSDLAPDDGPRPRKAAMAPGTERIPLADHVADAAALLAAVRGTQVHPVSGAAVGRIAAGDSRARVDVPGRDNSQMDGFAVAAADLPESGAIILPAGAAIAAGDAPGELAPGTTRPIMTGAPVPRSEERRVGQARTPRG